MTPATSPSPSSRSVRRDGITPTSSLRPLAPDPLRVAMLAPPWITVPPAGYGGVESVVSALTEALVALRPRRDALLRARARRSAARVETLLGTVHPRRDRARALRVRPRRPRLRRDRAARPARGLRRRPRPLRLHRAGAGRPPRRAVRPHAARPVRRRDRARSTPATATRPRWSRSAPRSCGRRRSASSPTRSSATRSTSRPGRCARPRTTTCSGSGASTPRRARTARSPPPARPASRSCSPASSSPARRRSSPPRSPRTSTASTCASSARSAAPPSARCSPARAALLMPIRWSEPFGMVMIEALACGTPVIAFDEGAAPEVVVDGVTGFLVDDEAEMAAAVAPPAVAVGPRLPRLGRRALRRRRSSRRPTPSCTPRSRRARSPVAADG